MTKLIVSFSHSNYLNSSAGTERSIRETYKTLYKENVHHLNVFPIRTYMVANLNDKFIGIYKSKILLKMIMALVHKHSYELSCIHLQHLMNHNIISLKTLLNGLGVPIVLFLHDFYTVCKSPHFLTHENKFCGIAKPTTFKCSRCKYVVEGQKHYTLMSDFLVDLFPLIKAVIAPSKFVIKSWLKIFPVYEKKAVVRSHLLIKTEFKKLPIVKERIRIAFVGSSKIIKGYEKWLELVYYLKEKYPQDYEFYYFGNGSDKNNGIKNVYVSIASQGEKAMIQNLKKHSIHCALLWSLAPETYSYVYYELLISNVFVLTNTVSGNIVDAVDKYKNGVIFSKFKDCLLLVSKPNELRAIINNFRENKTVKAIDTSPNNNIKYLIQSSPNKLNCKLLNKQSYFKLSNKFFSILYLARLKCKSLI